MGLWEFTKHAIGGGILTAYAGRKVNKYVAKNGIPEESRAKYVGPVVGGVGGGVVGYYVAEKIAGPNKHPTRKEKLTAAAIGTATGAFAGLIIGDYLSKSKEEK